eukprot:TRINITY_DN3649_c0_g1_i1.p1 TRINITY_DN3649_c0_g1~~TRINITY_DN3649_c0_g1_i1.p1  ORF type:complete len:344 (+),score=106.48 TRINITY_DN3649_c0_g1_i1:653-1684(+)
MSPPPENQHPVAFDTTPSDSTSDSSSKGYKGKSKQQSSISETSSTDSASTHDAIPSNTIPELHSAEMAQAVLDSESSTLEEQDAAAAFLIKESGKQSKSKGEQSAGPVAALNSLYFLLMSGCPRTRAALARRAVRHGATIVAHKELRLWRWFESGVLLDLAMSVALCLDQLPSFKGTEYIASKYKACNKAFKAYLNEERTVTVVWLDDNHESNNSELIKYLGSTGVKVITFGCTMDCRMWLNGQEAKTLLSYPPELCCFITDRHRIESVGRGEHENEDAGANIITIVRKAAGGIKIPFLIYCFRPENVMHFNNPKNMTRVTTDPECVMNFANNPWDTVVNNPV